MIIRKLFKAKSTHLVRNCYSERCKFSIHSHTGIIEVFLEANKLDNAGMIVDFGVLKNEVKDFIDSFDHAYLLWNKESDDYKQFIYNNSDRWIELPMSPSAESLAVIMLYVIDKILCKTQLNNNEGEITVRSVRYHETATGYAEAFLSDFHMMIPYSPSDIIISDSIQQEWKNKNMWNELIMDRECLVDSFIYDKPIQQIK